MQPSSTGKARFGLVGPPWWDDRPLAIIGAGPSIRGLDLDRVRTTGARVLAVKEIVWDAPWADACISLHTPWLRIRADRFAEIRADLYLGVDDDHPLLVDDVPGATFLIRDRGDGLSDDPARLVFGGTSGYGAVNLAYLKRARDIVLFGFDFGQDEWGRSHYTDAGYYVDHYNQSNNRQWSFWARNFDATVDKLGKAGVEVLNACPGSAIKAYERCTINAGLEHLHRLGPARDARVPRRPGEPPEAPPPDSG